MPAIPKGKVTGYLVIRGEIICRVPSEEYLLLKELYISREEAKGLLSEFGYTGTVYVTDMDMHASIDHLYAQFTLSS